ncbi:MBL fold metallo-hydrolase [Candidatus Woesearchaeota archaeon]|nr:MAG: MBL fold metallo-hydrolase [Candidatus Woesearchaeota archaeon]
MEIKILGAAREVGRSCIELCTKEFRALLDAGIKLEIAGPEYPVEISNIGLIDAVFLSHAHLDHSGALPLFFHRGLSCGVLCTAETALLTKLLLKDAHKIEVAEHHHPGYGKEDIRRVVSHIEKVRYNEKKKLKTVSYEFIDAGHIPGSSMVMLEVEGKRLLYTGDFNTVDTNLINGFKERLEADVMIIESTYGAEKHPNRDKEEEAFLNKIEEVVNAGGSVIIAAFAIGRAQEVLLMLQKRRFKVPIYMDGMAVKATDFILAHPVLLSKPKELEKAYNRINIVKGSRERKQVLNKQAIVITTSGMITGGPVIEYMKHIASRKDCALMMTGYQTIGSGGLQILETGFIDLDGERTKVECFYKKYVFSAHAGQQGLQWMIKTVRPKILIINHGQDYHCSALAQFANQYCKKVYVPRLGDVITV